MPKKYFGFEFNLEKVNNLNSFVLQEGYKEKIEEIRRINFAITQSPTLEGADVPDDYSSIDNVIEPIDSIGKIKLDPKNGCEFSKNTILGGYDESKLKFETLEGTINITSHTLIEIANGEYYPVSYLTVHFYSRSKDLIEKSEYIRYSENPEIDSALDYAMDRNHFMMHYALDQSVLFIDGPLIGGNVSSYAIDLVDYLHKKNIIPIFVVKNSGSNLIVENIKSLKGKYNSDLHWAYRSLKPGERSNYFLYTDLVNRKNTKILCYIKPFSAISPQRVEFHPNTMSNYGEYLDSVLDLVFYSILVHGDRSNPQARPIAVAEMYSREVINSANVRSLLRSSSLTPTINQERFGV